MEAFCTQLFLLACLGSTPALSASPLASPLGSPSPASMPQGVDKDGPAISPFAGMRMNGDSLEVQVDKETWYRLVKINKVDAKSLVASSHKLCGGQWWKRLREDLPALLSAMGHKPGTTVNLEVVDLKTNRSITMKDVVMTHKKRQALRRGKRAGGFRPAAMARPKFIIVDAAKKDLDQLVKLLDENYSYRHRKGVDLKALVKAAKQRLETGTPTQRDFLEEIDLIMKAFGDGHSRVSKSPNRPESTGYTPFLIGKVKGGYVAFKSDRSDYLDPNHPFITEMAGRPIEDWVDLSRKHVTQGSPQFQDYVAVRSLRYHNEQRRLLGLRADDDVKITLRGENGTNRVKLDLVGRAPFFGKWPVTQTKRLEGDIGYLRIPRMTSDAKALDEIDAAMQGFRDTRGLVIDLRSNGGGTRDILRRLFPYFMSENDHPHVANIAAYRLPAGLGDPMKVDGYLSNRGLYPMSWAGWSKRQRKAIALAQRQFEPEWKLPRDAFSTWHYFVLDRSDNAKAYHYDKPITVLVDTGCFSATDIFLGAVKGWKNVTLVGQASGGGSGRAQRHTLSTGVQLRISSMASFRPNGQLYENRGVQPDVLVEPIASDFILGGSDSTLARALDQLGRR